MPATVIDYADEIMKMMIKSNKSEKISRPFIIQYSVRHFMR